MKKITLILALILFPSIVFAAPFLICDPQPEVKSYRLTGPAWVVPTVAAKLDGSLLLDVSAALVGETSITVSACSGDPLWGEVCSEAVPFVFSRPQLSAPSQPANIRLSVSNGLGGVQ